MKKTLAIVTMIIMLLSFGGCAFNRTIETEGDFTVVIAGEENLVYEIRLDDVDITQGALSIMLYLKETEGLDLVYENSAYGAYISEVGSLKTDSNGYVSIFTSYEQDWDITDWCLEREVEGVLVATSGVGISSMSIVAGGMLYFEYITY